MLNTKKRKEDGILTVVLEGRLDTNTASVFGDELKAELADAQGLILDAAKLEYISSAGLRVILTAQQYMEANSLPDVKLINVNEMVAGVFRATGFDKIMDMEIRGEAASDSPFFLEDALKQKDLQLHQRMTESIFALRKMLQSFLDRFPDFTDHSILHSLNVINYCNLIIGKEQADRLAPEECYALIMACYLHDIGMGINDRDLQSFLESPEAGHFTESIHADDMPRTVRALHHELSGFLIRKYAGIFDFPSEEITYAVIQISRGHRKTDLYDREEFADINAGDAVIRTAYLAAVLRIADEMDVANDRNPDILYDTSGLTAINDIMAFGIHESILSAEITDDSLILHVRPKSAEFIPALEKTADDIQKKLDYCRDVAEKRSDLRITQKKVLMDRGAQNNMDNRNTKKTKRLARGAIRRMILLAVVLILGIGTAVVSIFWEQDLQMYSDFAYSYTRMAAETIDGDKVREYIETGETDEYYEKIRQLLNVIAENADLRYMYVVIPQESGLLYVWDAQPEHDARPLLDLWEYSSDYPRYAAEAAYNEGTEQFEAYRYKDMDLATAISPLKDSEGNTVAIVAADLLITRIREGIIKILVNVVASVGIIMIMAMAIYYFTVRRQILTPLETLKEAVSGIVDNLDRKESVKIDVHTGDEIETVARSIEEMDGKLRSYIDENSRITAEKERVNTELALATRIQADMLPNIFPAFPERTEFNIHAFMTPAKEVGGDFYDFFFVDHDHMALVIADVSGKGVPAAMFMMMVKSMIQTQVMSGHSPKDALETVNQLICDNNKEGMFISVWLGIVDVKSGVLIAANAGHEYPIIKKPGGNFEILKDKHGFVIGGMEGMKYTEYELQMEPGAKIFVYTDGVPEATDCHFDLFGMDRTLEALNSAADADPEGILKAVEDAVAEFVGRAEQFDDLTMLCFEYKGA